MPKFPFTNYHELNLDWILKKVDALFDASEENAQTIRTYNTRLTAAEQTATSAGTAATAAQQLADAASANANSALSVAGTANTKADSALTAATNAADAVAGALTTAQEAQQTAASAVATATDAAATASSLESLANTANQNATAALETAQTADQKAVTAQTAAATADQKAVAAQTAATTNAGNITTLQTDVSNLNHQISESITPAIEEIETALDGKAPVIVNTASGDIASFSDGADGMPIKSLVANIEPVQDLHGYDYPWPGGGGKNKLPTIDSTQTINGVVWTLNADGSVKISGTATVNSVYDFGRGIVTLAAGTYTTFDRTVTGVYSVTVFKIVDGTASVIKDGGGSFTLSEDTSVFVRYAVMSGTTVNTTIYPQLEVESTTITFAPYSNICPISGHTGASVTRTGKNLYHCENFTRSFNAITVTCEDDVFTVTGSGAGQIAIPGSFTAIGNVVTSTDKIFVLSPNNIRLYGARRTASGSVDYPTFSERSWNINAGGGINVLNIQTNADFVGPFTFSFQIEFGSTATDYEPYQGTTINVNWETEAGTVYGGTLDIISGVLTVNRTSKVLDGVAPVSDFRSFAGAVGYNDTSTQFPDADYSKPILCNQLVTIGPGISQYYGACKYSGTSFYFWFQNEAFTSEADAKAKVAAANIQCVYYVLHPATYQLTPQQINTLLGSNNIYSDVGSIADVQYPADTKLYIDGKIAELQALVLEN